ncbi:3'-5' exonuclease [Streptomyces violascens]|uniref:3'-5' exonuclease n=1 Tax=Streptomyces violascens TaxID=67381 RepID=A0ABQ3QX87_9ACTN|nr:3'-5' exonuclease [Streptomyces violascens]GGU12972.1 3'-5' exonuclease [Streptomyces violascens]GHI41875.1 3'-5' exonuclease [Streptomyces violascens]
MSWHTGRLAGFDLETTGVDVENDRIVTACVVCCGGGLPTRSATWLADPGIEIPEEAAKVHGITTEKARTEGRPAAEVIEQVIASLLDAVEGGLPIVAMNASFDLTVLDREARRHGAMPLTDLIGEELRVVDPRVLDKHIAKYRSGSRTLTALCATYQVALDGAHSADADALAACRLAWRMGMVTPTLAELSLAQLHEKQIGWAREQGESLAAYFRRTPGKEEQADGVRTEWPLIPHQRSAS